MMPATLRYLRPLAKIDPVHARFERVLRRLDKMGARPLAVAIAEEHTLTLEDLLAGRRRFPIHNRARWHLWAVLYGATGNYKGLSRLLEWDHTTIMYGVLMHDQALTASYGGVIREEE